MGRAGRGPPCAKPPQREVFRSPQLQRRLRGTEGLSQVPAVTLLVSDQGEVSDRTSFWKAPAPSCSPSSCPTSSHDSIMLLPPAQTHPEAGADVLFDLPIVKRHSGLHLPRAALRRSQPCKFMFAQPGTPKALYNYYPAFLFPPSVPFSRPLRLLRFLSDDVVEGWVHVRSHPGSEHAAWR